MPWSCEELKGYTGAQILEHHNSTRLHSTHIHLGGYNLQHTPNEPGGW